MHRRERTRFRNPPVTVESPGVRLKLLVASIVVMQSLLSHAFVAQRFPLSADDFSYLYQAKLFAAGQLYAQDPLYDYRNPWHRCIAVSCLQDDHGHRFSKYPPGWPAVLSLGVLAHAPWLVQPLVAGALTFLILGYVEERSGHAAVIVAALLLTLCFFYAYYGGSYRPHVAVALCVFGAFLAFGRSRERAEHRTLLIAFSGIVLGISALMRYLDWVPIGLWIVFTLIRRGLRRDLLIFIVSLALVAGGNLAWNWTLSGNPLVAPAYLGGQEVGLRDELRISWTGLVVTADRLALLVWVFPPVLMLLRYSTRMREVGVDQTPLRLFLANVGVYALFPNAVGGPGPRYLLSYFPFLVIAVVDVYDRIVRHSPTAARWWQFVIAAQVVGSLVFGARETYTLYWRRDVERTVAQAFGVDARLRGVVLRSGTYRTDVEDLMMNPPDLAEAAPLYLAPCDSQGVQILQHRFAGRQWFAYTFPGHLVPETE
jgi:hypothetical protein